MREYHTKIEINAPVEKVWDVLTGFSAYPDWNPLVSALSGDIREGGIIKTTIVPLQDTFFAKLLSFKEHKEVIWQGKRIAKFLLAGKHYYRLSEKENQATLLEHRKYFTGILSPFIQKKLLHKMEAAFNAHNEALKTKVEYGE